MKKVQPIKLQFEPSGYFYEMVTAYTTAITGLILYSPILRDSVNKINSKKKIVASLTSCEKPVLQIKLHEQIKHIDDKYIDLGKVTDNLAYMLINTAFESTKNLLDKNKPMHEFFRHLRHGASHGGKWSFKGSEPIRKAHWRNRTITNKLQGKRLWELNLKPGDILVLLHDIEKSLDKVKVN